jgi:hypothetical protein
MKYYKTKIMSSISSIPSGQHRQLLLREMILEDVVKEIITMSMELFTARIK